MIFNIYLAKNKVNKTDNEYSDSVIDKTCKYKVRMNCNNFVSVGSLLSIYNEEQSSLGKQTIKRNSLS